MIDDSKNLEFVICDIPPIPHRMISHYASLQDQTVAKFTFPLFTNQVGGRGRLTQLHLHAEEGRHLRSSNTFS
jgi:hypothetical protein